MMVIVEDDGGHVPLEIVHCKTFTPSVNPVTVELLSVGVVIEAVPEKTDQEPVPTEGRFPFNVVLGVKIQIV